ncbi:helix-turn-helix transcriptional regulator [Nonomuraea recticatena]|uniref:Helix-turn-helix domain-containing protein n=1 Tax=Nonomuraea recticatena TaxID=46178 RepID=A0ABP6F1M2_9ACTN
MSSSDDRSAWTFLTHHARVLTEIARNPHARLRDIAASIGITERAVQGIVSDLHQTGYVTREKAGRRNHYRVNPDQHFRHPAEANLPIRLLIDMFTQHDLSSGTEPAAAPAHEPSAGGRTADPDGQTVLEADTPPSTSSTELIV